MMRIDYDHSKNLHSLEGPAVAFGSLLPAGVPASLLDVGCGTGTWLRAALDSGLTDVLGIDGVNIPSDQLLISEDYFRCLDITKPIDLGRRFAAVICLETAEHLNTEDSGILLDTLTRHSDSIIFSAACPGQRGQHHVNCRWPAWWQQLFNARGYVCEDTVRWRLWDEPKIEPWYRQNMFIARYGPALASKEARIRAVIHPDMMPYMTAGPSEEALARQIANGSKPLLWYIKTLIGASIAKANRRFSGHPPQLKRLPSACPPGPFGSDPREGSVGIEKTSDDVS